MQERDIKRNWLAMTGDFVLFYIGVTFYDPMVVVPAFIKEFTNSGMLVGALAALRILMITLPQIWAASFLRARPRKKPLLVWASFLGRSPILLVAIATALWTRSHLWLVIATVFFSVITFYISEAMNGVTWPAMIAKVIPPRSRGRFFTIAQLLASLGTFGAGYAVSRILGADGTSDPARWALMFACAFVGLLLSPMCMLFIREAPDTVKTTAVDVRESLRLMRHYLREDATFRRLVIAQLILRFAAAGFPFYIVRARELFANAGTLIGAFLVAQSVGGAAAALATGYLIDWRGSRAAIRVSSLAQVVSLGAVALGGIALLATGLYFAAFFLLGFFMNSSWWSFSTYLLEHTDEERRPVYLATTGILSSLTFINPIVVGALFNVWSPELIFAASALLSGIGTALAWGLSQPPKERPVPQSAGANAVG